MSRPRTRPASGRLDRVGGTFARLYACCFDALLALVLGGVGAFGMYLASRPGYPLQGYREPDVLAFALLAAQAVPLIGRRRCPVRVLAVILVATAAIRYLHYPVTAADASAAVAFYTFASRYGLTRQLQALVATAAVVVPLTLLGRVTLQQFVLAHLLLVVAWVVGDTIRRRGELIVALEQRAVAVQSEQQQRIRQAISDERVRIAQELHDMAAHALGVIAIQSQVAERSLAQRPEQTRKALGAISTLAEEALTDLRRLLGFLRSEGDELESRRPQPTLEDLESLVDGFRQAGLPVEIITEGKRRAMSAPVQTSAYRVIQEALTNTLKHAGRATALVAVRYRAREIEIEVTDTGRGPDPNGRSGQGLIGMRERVALFGGELTYGAGPHGGFVVRASLPLKEASAA